MVLIVKYFLINFAIFQILKILEFFLFENFLNFTFHLLS